MSKEQLKKGDIVWLYFPSVAETYGEYGFLKLKIHTIDGVEAYCDIIEHENWDIHEENFPIELLFKTKYETALNAYKDVIYYNKKDLKDKYEEIGYLNYILVNERQDKITKKQLLKITEETISEREREFINQPKQQGES